MATNNKGHPNDSAEDHEERESDAVADRKLLDRQVDKTNQNNEGTDHDETELHVGIVGDNQIGTFLRGLGSRHVKFPFISCLFLSRSTTPADDSDEPRNEDGVESGTHPNFFLVYFFHVRNQLRYWSF